MYKSPTIQFHIILAVEQLTIVFNIKTDNLCCIVIAIQFQQIARQVENV